MTERSCLTIILAAGEGTRMRARRPKVLHEIAGRPILAHVLDTARAAGSEAIAVVVGPDAGEVRALVEREAPHAAIFEQCDRLGTGHAVLMAREAIERGYDDIIVMFGDTPLVEPETLGRARKSIEAGNAVAVVGFRTGRPAGYGRLIEANGQLIAIREDRDCTAQERAITFCNSGLMGLDGARALDILERIGNANAKGEYYLTECVAIARLGGGRVVAVEGGADELLGVNTQAELASAEAMWQDRRRRTMMLAGVTMQDPDSVHFSWDTVAGSDCRIEPNVWFGPGVRIGDGVRIRAFSHIEGAIIGDAAEVGPFARLRAGTVLGTSSKVGNFCETKKAEIADGAKVNHLTYIGDATIGAGANIGAGTITCNYDGHNKYRTIIGEGAFIGSNSALVAPVSIGARTIVAAGSVVTADVPDDALAFGRARQTVRPGLATLINAQNAARKAGSKS